jgi:hypothetical protein
LDGAGMRDNSKEDEKKKLKGENRLWRPGK